MSSKTQNRHGRAESIEAIAGLLAVVGVLYLVTAMLSLFVAMSFIEWYNATGVIESAKIAWLTGPAPLPQIYMFLVPAGAVFAFTMVAIMTGLIASEYSDK